MTTWAHAMLDGDPERLVLRVLVLAWIAAMGVAAPRRAAPWLWAMFALIVRLGFGEAGALMGRAYPYQHFLGYVGKIKSIPLYGQGWFATMDWMRPIFGSDPGGLNRANLAFSVLTVLWLWEVVRRLTDDDRTAHVAAALLSILPLAVALAQLEVAFILCALLEVTIVVGVVRQDRVGAWLAACGAVVLAHTRPFEIAFAVVGVLVLMRMWRALGAASLVAIAVRVWEIGIPNGHDGFPNAAPDAWAPTTLLRQIFGSDSSVLLFNLHVDPFWLFPLAVAGLCVAWRAGSRRAVAVLAVAAALTTVPYAHMFFPTDTLRFQLPAATWWCALASLATPWILRRGWPTRAAIAATVTVGVIVADHPLQDLVTVREYRFLATTIARLPAGAVLRYDPVWDASGLFAAWAERIGPIHAVPLDASPPSVGEYVYVGVPARVTDRPPDRERPVYPSCDGEAVAAIDVGPFSGNLYELDHPSQPVHLMIERVRACPDQGSTL